VTTPTSEGCYLWKRIYRPASYHITHLNMPGFVGDNTNKGKNQTPYQTNLLLS